MNDEILEAELLGTSTAVIAWTGIEDGPCNLIGKEFPSSLSNIIKGDQPAGDSERLANRGAVLSELHISPFHTAVPKLQHGGIVKYVNTHNPFVEDLKCDALVTDNPALALTMTFADCPPVVIFDDEARVLALVHAGWKPIAADIIEKTLAMMHQLGAHRSRMQAFIGPGVRKCCYEVAPDVATKVDGLPHVGHVHIDLSDIIGMRLAARGVDVEKIHQHPTCTCCGAVDTEKGKKPLYFSYRREKKNDPLNAGMLVAWIS